jgi:hypothetical protein
MIMFSLTVQDSLFQLNVPGITEAISLLPLHKQLFLEGDENEEWLEGCPMEYPERKVIFSKAADARSAFKASQPVKVEPNREEQIAKIAPVEKVVKDDDQDWLDDLLG